MGVKETVITYASHDGKSQIYALLWEAQNTVFVEGVPAEDVPAEDVPAEDVPAEGTQPRGIIQIIHGAAEHCARYRDFASYLVSEGFIVCANDHIGHGKSVNDKTLLGHMPVKGGKDILLADVDALRRIVSKQYPDLPYCMLGHSMGSFILRLYLARFAKGITAAVLVGTGQQPKPLSVFGGVLARVIAKSKGAEYRSFFLHNLGMGVYAKTVPDARTPFDWISIDPAVVNAYVEDEACGMVFSVGAYATLTDLTGEMVTKACALSVPNNLPLLFVSGTKDPVGENGKAVKTAVKQYIEAGLKHVGLQLYDGLRHEVLNEPVREKVYRDIADWLENALDEQS